MYIIVAGGGKVGYYLSQNLLAEGHEVLLIERNSDRVTEINDVLGAVAVTGDGAEAGMQAAAKPHGTVSWPMATYFPYLWNPCQHMFLKPEVTRENSSGERRNALRRFFPSGV